MLTRGCGLIGGDMDHCRDPLTGVVEPWAQAVVDLNETYLEVSPSGTGIRFWALEDAVLLRTIKSSAAGVELYPYGRYLTFTGDQILGSPASVNSATRTLRMLQDRVQSFKAASGPTSGGAAPGAAVDLDEAFRRKAYQHTPMGKINQAALGDFGAWVPEIFPTASLQPGTGAWRVKSADLGRGLQEDLSLSPDGIVDFGVHDLGDAREGKRTPIDIVIEWLDVKPRLDATEAAEWLAGKLNIPFGPGSGSSPGPSPDATIQDAWLKALARLRAASPHPAFATGAAVDMAHGSKRFDPAHTGPVALRPGITDRLTRGFVSSVSSAANAGKSTYLGSEAVAVACERADLLGLSSLDWCGNVLIVSNEENANTLTSRWKGVMKAHGLKASDFKHHLDVWPTDAGRLRLGRGSRDQNVTPTLDGVAFVNWLAERAEEGSPVAVLGFDTLISIFEGVDESSFVMDKAIGLLIQVAEAGFIAVDVMQHQGKSGEPETTKSYRGSSSIFAALAEMSTLAPLTAEEGAEFGFNAAASARTIRLRGQRQRDGRVPGDWYFVREIIGLAAEDPRAPGVLASKETAILKPIAVSRAATVGSGLRVLWDHQQLGGLTGRGSGRGGQVVADWAHSILGKALGWTRAQAEKSLEEWERDNLVETYEAWPDGTHKRVLVRVREEPKEPVSPY